MKKLHYFAAACLLLASCSESGYVGDLLLDTQGAGEITFSQFVPNTTRAAGTSADAAKLGNKFVVYGFKMASSDAEAADGSTDNKVFDLYNVEYKSGSANTTLSNSNGWEYVGLTSVDGTPQTIKYWDFNCKYVFSAISCGTGVTFTKITDAATIAGSSVQDKGWQLTVPAGTTISNLYASDRKPIEKSKGGSSTYSFPTVDFTFYSLASKIRFAMYETVSGYSVKIDKCYYNSTNSSTYFGVDGTFKGMNSGGATTLIVTYDASNHPVLSYNSESTSKYLAVGGNLINTTLGTASNAATYDHSDATYSLVLPYESKNETDADKKENVLKLKVDYTLTSTDGSGEEIKVYGATATVPTAYTQWKNNYAYTYLFKISDNTSGSTGNDPHDPKGLFPITFDACVTSSSDGLQETITTVAEPSITTYQSGSVGNEYKAGSVTVSVYDQTDKDVTLSKSNLKLYSAYTTDNTAITEKNVENYKNNGIVLTDVSNAITNYATFSAKTATFTAVAGKTYVVEYTKSPDKFYKVVKVEGSPTTVYKFEAFSSSVCASGDAINQIEEGGTFYVKAEQMVGTVEGAVTGAEKNFHADTKEAFDITETVTAGTYQFKAKAGTSGTKEIKINEGDTKAEINILPYEFDPIAVTVIGDENDTETATLKLSTSAVTSAVVGDFACSAGLTVTGVTDGVITIQAAKKAKSGTVTYSHGDEIVATLDVTVQNYSFTEPTKKIINIGSVEASEKTTSITMKLGGAAITTAKAITTTADTKVLTSNPSITDVSGNIVLEAGTVPGIATVKAPDENEISIEVKNFTITSNTSTGATRIITFMNNGAAENVKLTVSAGVLAKDTATGAYSWTGITENATVKYTYNGQTFTLYKATGI